MLTSVLPIDVEVVLPFGVGIADRSSAVVVAAQFEKRGGVARERALPELEVCDQQRKASEDDSEDAEDEVFCCGRDSGGGTKGRSVGGVIGIGGFGGVDWVSLIGGVF